jgi:hypothetical protein
MKLRFLVPALALAFTTIAAHAQVGIYVNPVVSRITNSVADTGPFAFLGSGETAQTFGGVDFGAYYDFAHFSKVDVGADMRDAIEHGNNASLNSFLVGVRVAAKPMSFAGLKPYVQVSAGDARTKAPKSNAHVNKLQYGIFVGVDKALAKHVDWRILEVSYGSVDTISSHNFNGPTPIPAARILTLSTGFVFRFK